MKIYGNRVQITVNVKHVLEEDKNKIFKSPGENMTEKKLHDSVTNVPVKFQWMNVRKWKTDILILFQNWNNSVIIMLIVMLFCGGYSFSLLQKT